MQDLRNTLTSCSHSKEDTISEICGDSPCPKCRAMGGDKTGNHLIHFENGNKFCNRCGYKEIKSTREVSSIENISDMKKGGDIPERKLLSKFTELYGLRIEHNTTTGEPTAYHAPLYEVGTGKLLGYQTRILPKKFTYSGSIRGKPWQFAGQHLVRESGKFLIIVEGFLDTIAAKQMLSEQKKSWSVVGVMSTSVEKQVRENIEWLNGFETIVLALDQDSAARKAVEVIVGLLPPEKVKIAVYSENDPCDMLVKDKGAEFVHSLVSAKSYTPKGILNAADVLQDFLLLKDTPSVPFPPEWKGVQEKTGGMRPGEIIVYTAGTGIGKSQFCDEVVAHLLIREPETKICILKMEHNNAVGL
ncbi:MAG TPA: toprim domain-containing protein, partial [Ghiorsea sp.]|nr:toprim domain-containing protein [Ghiorsea sp.]